MNKITHKDESYYLMPLKVHDTGSISIRLWKIIMMSLCVQKCSKAGTATQEKNVAWIKAI